LKRVKVHMSVEDLDHSRFLGVIEYRGNAMVITRSDGRFHSAKLAEILTYDFEELYGREGLEIRAEKEDGSICECHIFNPDDFLGYLHYTHNCGGIHYRE